MSDWEVQCKNNTAISAEHQRWKNKKKEIKAQSHQEVAQQNSPDVVIKYVVLEAWWRIDYLLTIVAGELTHRWMQ